MPPLVLPATDELRNVLSKVTLARPAIGIIDTRSGRVYILPAADLDVADHATLVKIALRIYDIDKATHVRGFVIGVEKGCLQIANISGLNPLDNEMEPEIFQELELVLVPFVGARP